ncbi:MAG: 23S rRNA (pseudouridine(1915)-N(3))-methyltransferase RlmH [Deltaproteobacteria bacterium]|nr:23S rRNA (pseudouridine(1915)-N(3))-methyltransferase RlmH [Deltaproteobacteria bacterium]
MKLVFCFSGKTPKGPIKEVLSDYQARISRYVPVEIIEAKTLKIQSRQGHHVLLSPDGKLMTSEAFAEFIGECMLSGKKHLFFYTGGPTGFDASITDAADLKLSLSCMTFNHQMIRTMLLEQVYRAFTILNNEPYHK